MISLNKEQKGFTIIELVIVTLLIGILALIVFITYRGISQDNRNKTRESHVSQLSNLLEYYYGQNSVYPTLANLNDEQWRNANNFKLDAELLKDPSGKQAVLVSTPTAGAFTYVTTPADCNNNGIDCTGYTLTANYEGGGTFEKKSMY
jgi:prepilin-type N-terminal cleavage/methylation domain-containing protein